jgi:beta-lactamase class D
MHFRLAIATLLVTSSAQAAPPTGLEQHFGGKPGCFLILDLKTGGYLARVGGSLCEKRLSPCSTFKIPNALIGLDLGVLKDGSTRYAWGGKAQHFKAWERDHTLETALRDSVVWYFRKLAAQVSLDHYAQYLDDFHYGNRDLSGGQTRFWLESSLRISAQEQIAFLARLYRGQLAVSARAARLVRELLPSWTSQRGRLSGKTGTGLAGEKPNLGWFVGRVATGDRELVFATLLEGEGASGLVAREATKKILGELRVW